MPTSSLCNRHHRLCHAAGQNFSLHIRMSCFYDFAQEEMCIGEDGFVARGSPLDRAPAPLQDGHAGMWRDWSEQVIAIGGGEPIVVPEAEEQLRRELAGAEARSQQYSRGAAKL